MFWKSITVILLLALIVRVLAGAWWQDRLPGGQQFGFGDSESYWMLAKNISTGQPYRLNPDRRVFRTPGYPLLLAPLFLAGGEETPAAWARWQNACFGTVAVALVMAIAWRLFDDRTALLAGLAAALYPGAIATSTFVLSEGPFCPWMVAHVLLWIIAFRAPDPRGQILWGAAAGLAAGLATLIRPSWLLFSPFAIGVGLAICLLPWLSAVRRRDRASGQTIVHKESGRFVGGQSAVAVHLRIGTAMLCTLAVVMSPWWIRNARIVGSFVPTTLQVGESLYDGLNPTATGASDMRFVERFRQQLAEEDRQRPQTVAALAPFEQRLDRRMRDRAVAWATEHPGRVVQLAGIKFLRIWNVWPNEPTLRSWAFRSVVAAGYIPLVLLGLGGVAAFARRGWPTILCLMPAVYLTCLHMVFVGSIRYRQPPMLLLIVLAAGMLLQLWEAFAERRPARGHLNA